MRWRSRRGGARGRHREVRRVPHGGLGDVNLLRVMQRHHPHRRPMRLVLRMVWRNILPVPPAPGTSRMSWRRPSSSLMGRRRRPVEHRRAETKTRRGSWRTALSRFRRSAISTHEKSEEPAPQKQRTEGRLAECPLEVIEETAVLCCYGAATDIEKKPAHDQRSGKVLDPEIAHVGRDTERLHTVDRRSHPRRRAA